MGTAIWRFESSPSDKITENKNSKMGSLGSWNASLSLLKKINISQKEENSLESIEKFIKKNSNKLVHSKKFNNLKNDDILIGVVIENEDYYEKILMVTLGLENVNPKDFMKNKIYEKYEEHFFEDLLEEIEIEDWVFNVEIKELETKLKFLNLKVLAENLGDWDPTKPTFIDDEEVLAECGDYIYCHNDNSDSELITITQKFINSLNVGDKLVLKGNGDGEHC